MQEDMNRVVVFCGIQNGSPLTRDLPKQRRKLEAVDSSYGSDSELPPPDSGTQRVTPPAGSPKAILSTDEAKGSPNPHPSPEDRSRGLRCLSTQSGGHTREAGSSGGLRIQGHQANDDAPIPSGPEGIPFKPEEEEEFSREGGSLSEDDGTWSVESDLDKLDTGSRRYIVIDGTNVALSHGDHRLFSCRGIQLCVEWFRVRGHGEITAFVPHWRKETLGPDFRIKDQEILLQLEKEHVVVFTPSRHVGGRHMVCHDDRYIIKLAAEVGGVVVSNDSYEDLAAENPEFKRVVDECCLRYTFDNGCFTPLEFPEGQSLDAFLSCESRPEEPETSDFWNVSNYKDPDREDEEFLLPESHPNRSHSHCLSSSHCANSRKGSSTGSKANASISTQKPQREPSALDAAEIVFNPCPSLRRLRLKESTISGSARTNSLLPLRLEEQQQRVGFFSHHPVERIPSVVVIPSSQSCPAQCANVTDGVNSSHSQRRDNQTEFLLQSQKNNTTPLFSCDTPGQSLFPMPELQDGGEDGPRNWAASSPSSSVLDSIPRSRVQKFLQPRGHLSVAKQLSDPESVKVNECGDSNRLSWSVVGHRLFEHDAQATTTHVNGRGSNPKQNRTRLTLDIPVEDSSLTRNARLENSVSQRQKMANPPYSPKQEELEELGRHNINITAGTLASVKDPSSSSLPSCLGRRPDKKYLSTSQANRNCPKNSKNAPFACRDVIHRERKKSIDYESSVSSVHANFPFLPGVVENNRMHTMPYKSRPNLPNPPVPGHHYPWWQRLSYKPHTVEKNWSRACGTDSVGYPLWVSEEGPQWGPVSWMPTFPGSGGAHEIQYLAHLRLFYHFSAIFPVEHVEEVRKMLPGETDPRKICAAILDRLSRYNGS